MKCGDFIKSSPTVFKHTTRLMMLHLVLIPTFQVKFATGLDCFYCNSFVPGDKLPCPANQTENVDTWKAKYNTYNTYPHAQFCRIRVKKSDGSIVSQIGTSSCINNENDSFRKVDEFVPGKTFCCAKDGCNWDALTATQNLNISQIITTTTTTTTTSSASTNNNSSTSGIATSQFNSTTSNSNSTTETESSTILSSGVDWVPIVIICILIFILFVACFICICIRKKKKKRIGRSFECKSYYSRF